jgi:hypothetical protein
LGGVHEFLHAGDTANGANQLAMAIDTSGRTGIVLSYDIEIVSAQPSGTDHPAVESN